MVQQPVLRWLPLKNLWYYHNEVLLVPALWSLLCIWVNEVHKGFDQMSKGLLIWLKIRVLYQIFSLGIIAVLCCCMYLWVTTAVCRSSFNTHTKSIHTKSICTKSIHNLHIIRRKTFQNSAVCIADVSWEICYCTMKTEPVVYLWLELGLAILLKGIYVCWVMQSNV